VAWGIGEADANTMRSIPLELVPGRGGGAARGIEAGGRILVMSLCLLRTDVR
jgi:hypothetical protein